MTKMQFQVLCRQFLFRMVDLEILSADGDIKQLLGQFAALLVWVSSFIALGGLMVGGGPPKNPISVIAISWGGAHFLIATTMLIVGLFAVLSWDSSFPDRRDVLVLAPLPVRPRMLFSAKVAALGAALGLTVAAFNGAVSLTWPLFVFSPPGSGLIGCFRAFAAYWIAVLSAGAFVFCSLLGLQGLAAQLPRRYFLRISSVLQMAAFVLLVCGYVLEPSIFHPQALATTNPRTLAWWPTYWFFGLFEVLNGWKFPFFPQLARRAVAGLSIAAFGAGTAYLLSYLRTIRRVVEEPDIIPGASGGAWLPPFGRAVHTAVVQFAVRSLMRSRQHRVILAFYMGIGFAVVTLYVKSGARDVAWTVNGPLMANSIVVLCYLITGARMVIGMPLHLRANWVFQVTAMRPTAEYFEASRRTMLLLSAAPVCLGAAIVFFAIWPWRVAAGHSAVLLLLSLGLVDAFLFRFRKIPFTCSYLPGKSHFHMMFLGGMGLLLVSSWFTDYELAAMNSLLSFAAFLALLGVIAAAARLLANSSAREEEAAVQFEDKMPPAVQTLGLNRDGVVPLG
jgi:hypothetical protein